MEYYTIITIIILLALLFMLSVVLRSKNIDAEKRNGFIALYVMISITTFSEWLGTFFTGYSNNLVYWHKFAKFLELSITPIFPFICAKTIFSTSSKRNHYILYVITALLGIHTILEFLSMYYGFIFYIDNNGNYHNMKYYNIYIFVFIVSAIYFFIKTFMFSRYYQNKDIFLLIFIVLILLFGVSVQIVDSSLKAKWLTVGISSIFIYIYYTQLTMNIDHLTQLLNQHSYKNYLESCNYEVSILTFDINNFKSINDTFGHSYGDQVISLIGKTIKEVFGPYGYCFRIGGDEFSVFLKNDDLVDNLCLIFNEKIEIERKSDSRIPTTSIGHAHFTPGYQDINDVVKTADSNMYQAKKQQKNM